MVSSKVMKINGAEGNDLHTLTKLHADKRYTSKTTVLQVTQPSTVPTANQTSSEQQSPPVLIGRGTSSNESTGGDNTDLHKKSQDPAYNATLIPATLTSSIRNTSLSKAANTTQQRSSANLHNTSNATVIIPMLPLSIRNASLEKHTINNVTELKGGHSNRTALENGQFACPWYNGRMGNLMFQYASVYGLINQKGKDKPHNVSIILPKNNVLYKTFELPSAVIVDNFTICKTFVNIVEKKSCSFDKRLTNLTKGVNYRIMHYLQSWKYFMHVSEGMRKEFTFRPSVKEKAVDFVENLRTIYSNGSVSVTVVGIHIRRGDIMNEIHVRLGFEIASDKYIHNAVDYFIDKYKDVVFVACSDDANYSKEILNYNNISVSFSSYSAVEDFSILSSCDHVIMTVGTFGWWAAFLSGGTVVYYKHQYKADTHRGRIVTFEDFYPPSWIGL